MAALKAARKAKRLSQRELGVRAGVPQSHISKIESGAVDIKLSSLIELARALDLELILVPRKLVPAVRSVVGSGEAAPRPTESALKGALELKGLQDLVLRLQGIAPGPEQIKQLQRLGAAISGVPTDSLDPKLLEQIRNIAEGLKGIQLQTNDSIEAIRNATAAIQRVRNRIAHRPGGDLAPPRPAYTLKEDDDA